MKGRKKWIIPASAVGAALTGWIWWGNTALMVSRLTVASQRLTEAFSGIRIAQISDLHNTEFGPDNKRLLCLLEECAPDLIVITGDMVDSRRTDLVSALVFAEGAAGIAPTYYVPGNHEGRILEYVQLKTGLKQAGVTVLEDGYVLLRRGGEEITLCGMADPSFHVDVMDESALVQVEAMLENILEGTEGYRILLSHRPELIQLYARAGVDLVFSGHAHGGQFRFPGIGGLIGPGQGLFPTYDSGLYIEGDTQMVVSRGLGNSLFPFRLNNRPEIVLAELIRG